MNVSKKQLSVLGTATAYFIFQNNLGLTPGDCARLSNRRDCCEFLLLYETSLAMAKELKDAQIKNEWLQNEQAELKGHFK